MESYERQNRLREALSLRNMKQVELCERTGIKKASVNNWLAQRWQPKQDAIMKMARVLDVSEMWLAGYDVPMERPLAQKKSDELTQLILDIEADDDLKELFISITTLTKVQFNAVKSIVNSYKDINTLH
ncbi:MAG: helix-turn-helix transcriptional regulator [Lachnospiraceae bacterium]|nr:helix-turn-helix transcriptional regulator [Lachnospiraceae bacterium]